jgi:putative SOS response-associated peptidase YedK
MQQSKDAQALSARFKAKIKADLPVQSAHFNGFTYPKTPVISNQNPDEIILMNWGLIPSWAKDRSIQAYTLNAKIETLDEKPSFKNNIKNRCLILTDGFREWQWLDPKGKQKQAYLISRPNNALYSFAGIWSEWTDIDSGEIIRSYSMVTTEANELMAEIHNHKKRMPIILREDQEHAWLSGDDYRNYIKYDIELIAEKIN